MPRPPDTSWSFDTVIDFIDSSDNFAISLPEAPSSPRPSIHKYAAPITLGDFSSLFETIGYSLAPEPDAGPPALATKQSSRNKNISLWPNTRKDIINSETDASDGQDDAVPPLIDDLGESGDTADSPEDELEIDFIVVKPGKKSPTKKSKKGLRKAKKTEQLQIHDKEEFQPKMNYFAQKMTDLGELAPQGVTDTKIPVVDVGTKRNQTLARKTLQAVLDYDIPTIPTVTAVPRKPDAPTSKSGAVLLPAIPITTRQHPASAPVTAPKPSAVENLSAALSVQYNGRPGPYHQLVSGFVTPLPRSKNINLQAAPSVNIPVQNALHISNPFQQPPLVTNIRQPPLSRSQEDCNFDFLIKLIGQFPEDKKWLVSPMRLMSDKMSPQGLHVFVDASNILYGFKDMVKKTLGPKSSYNMSFDCLALLMERRRPVAKRMYAGSTRENESATPAQKFAVLAEDLGYQMDIYEQVYKVREPSENQKYYKNKEKFGWAKAKQMRTQNGSDSETGPAPSTPAPSAPKWVEQGVDESIHLKMCQSIIDADVPSTIVLATGDGSVAEYSDGFLANVERALKKGWKVELVSWKQAINGGYRNKAFRAKWGSAFRIIELDNYLSDMIDRGDEE